MWEPEIGLALCKEYVQLHQGYIYAKNNADKGLTVSIEIDLKNEILQNKTDEVVLTEEKTKKQDIVFKPIPEEHLAKNNAHLPVVLIVEDNYELRKFLKSQLQRFYRILEAENGKEGLELATKKLPDLIVSDIIDARNGWNRIT